MRPVVVTQTGAGTSAAIPLDVYIAPFQVSIFCHEIAAASYKLQYTYDNIFDSSITPIWIDSTDIPALSSGDKQSNFTVPVSACRLVVASGTVSITVQQAGIV
jgi:hypothetical protein